MDTQAAYIEDRVQQAVAGSQAALLDRIEGLISSKFTAFESKVSDTQKQISDSQLAKIEHNILSNDSYRFKRKSCEDQYKFNAKVATKLKDAKSNLDSGKNIPQATQDVAEGIEMISHRQKLIKMADASESGWRVVTEYETNPLASDSDDEKRINRAESRASKKLKLEKAKRVKKYSFFIMAYISSLGPCGFICPSCQHQQHDVIQQAWTLL